MRKLECIHSDHAEACATDSGVVIPFIVIPFIVNDSIDDLAILLY
ncbi:hypothetical protein N9L06_06690 [Mariniblastus sp.]|nr:hypothetical protein [Mariniblastus sp.]